MCRVIIILCILHVCVANFLKPVGVESVDGTLDPANRVNSTIYRIVQRYYCTARDFDDSYLLLYGSKGWKFPAQDVNLTLSYPTGHKRKVNNDSWEDFVVIGFKVNLYLDGSETTGYISEGGIFHGSISLTFLCSNISTLSYQFWLYGIPKTLSSETLTTHNNSFAMC